LSDMCLCETDGNHGRMIRDRNNTAIKRNGDGEKNSYAIDVVKDRDNATRALMHLTNESKNRAMMCTPAVLNALVKGASVTDEAIENDAKQLQEVRDSAIRAIERLATEFSNRHKMAHHDGLLVAIAHATEREAKLELQAKKTHGLDLTVEQDVPPTGGAGNSSGNDSVGSNSHNLALTPMKQRKQQQLQEPQHAFLAKPLLMSLLVAM